MPTPTINLGPYLINVPTETEKGHIRDSLDIGSAALLQGRFLDNTRLEFVDPNNSTRSIILDKTLFGSAVADRLRFARAVNVTGEVTTGSPIPLFDGTEDINLPITINAGAIVESKLAADSVVASKIKDGEITPLKLTANAPDWSGVNLSIFNPGIEFNNGITSDINCSIDFHSSFPKVTYDTRIRRNAGINGDFSILNAGNGAIKIGGLTIASDNTVTSSRQIIGGIEIIGNQINGTFANNAEIAINYENSDSTIANFLNTTIYNGKRETVSKFFGETKTLETYGPCRSITAGQLGWNTAGLESRANTGNALIALHAPAAGAGTAALLKHVRGGDGIEIRNADDTIYAQLKSARITSNDGVVINGVQPTLYLQDTDHRSAMVHVNSNVFYVLRGDGTNSLGWATATLNGPWPMELNLENNYATFGGGMKINGTLSVTGDVIAYSTSDKNLKTNIKNIESPLSKVKKINGVTFDWDASKQETFTGSDVGVIAQEIEAILPDAVTTRDNGYKAVKYEKIIPLLIESIKELKAEIDELKLLIK